MIHRLFARRDQHSAHINQGNTTMTSSIAKPSRSIRILVAGIMLMLASTFGAGQASADVLNPAYSTGGSGGGGGSATIEEPAEIADRGPLSAF